MARKPPKQRIALINTISKTSILSNRKNHAKESEIGIYYAGIWQELKLKESYECNEWAKKIILG